ncbi:MAG: hypothetical protein IT168_18535 [Bryobacterales bacterium]|nr:hypothetical protein [Bryobacterales bacterium]
MRPELVASVPGDTVAVIGGKVDPLRKAGLTTAIERVATREGFNPISECEQFVVAFDGKAPFVAAYGRFQRTDIEKKLTAGGGKPEQWQGKAVWTNGDTAAAFVSDQMVVAGMRPAVEASLNGKAGAPVHVKELIGRLPGDANLWAVALGGIPLPMIPERSNLANLQKVILDVRSVIVSANVANGVQLKATATSADEAGAKKLHDALRGLIGFARLSTSQERQDLLKLLDAIAVKQQAAEVNVDAYFTRDAVDQILALSPLPKAPVGRDGK